MKISRKSKIWISVLVSIGSMGGFAAVKCSQNPSTRVWFNPEFRSQVARFAEALFVTEYAYYDTDRSDFSQLTEQAIAGMAKSLDPYSSFLPPEDLKKYKERQDLKYAGAGFQTREIEEDIVVTRVFPNSPAKRADVKVGDRLLEVDGESVSGKSVQDCIRLTRGPPGTTVSLKVRGASGGERILDIVRAQVKTNPVDDYWVDPDGNGYLRLTKFPDRAGKEVEKALKTMQAQGMRCLVLDLRDNPGGYVDSAVKVAGFFLPPGQLIASVEGKLPELTREYRSEAQSIHLQIPMAVLIDKFSVSGAECLAGSLRAHGRAVLVGEKTFGKGVGQHLFPLTHGSGLNITVVRYQFPDGSDIDGTGLVPDHEVICDLESKKQLWIQRDQKGIIDPDEFESLFGLEPIPDPQWVKAIEVLSLNFPAE